MLTFPLSPADFIDRLPIKSVTPDLPEIVSMSQTGGGDILTEDLSPRLWRGEVLLAKLTPDEASAAMALIQAVRGPGRSFMAYDTRHPAPRNDPDGSGLVGATPRIQSLGANPRTLSLHGLPADYVLLRGDMLSFDYGAGPVRTALHQVVDETVTANQGGATPEFEVIPFVRAGAAAEAAVTLIKPACKAVILPNSVTAGTKGAWMTEGVAFSYVQTLR
ncbi:hypothetical protein [Aestuariivita sp.]|jgi:hypothetical protein|uniref:hypothetical protein n=1 Tax=Aestuariivita sp. TaxID=1872407 RepID=UPI0021724BBB|nr:hypothetical protein [Aestuariivita sp.]MCE8007130.1 hypothetical protein [Aestuariivita sp.]